MKYRQQMNSKVRYTNTVLQMGTLSLTKIKSKPTKLINFLRILTYLN